eukprot:TRINITY_DN62242_c0_g1_i1.p1 TRINITY_DN62242_c0_g1~~TRINITY_DN62242_c0_g1_i1.p1  ORF type:complete len:1491 (+),score=171.07 TRINITY_DN62242_c0_g1_i1:385-4473(+)
MASAENISALLGPYGSQGSRVAAEAAHNANTPLLIHNAALFDPSDVGDWPTDTSNLFSVSLRARDSLIESLDLLRAVAPHNITFFFPNKKRNGTVNEADAIARRACASAKAHAEKIGHHVGRTTSTSGADRFSRDFLDFRIYSVFVGCGSLRMESDFLLLARAMRLIPDAVVLMQAVETRFKERVTGSSASHVITPVAWNANDVEENNGVGFTSPKDFRECFQKRYDREPSIRSVEAVAAAQALLGGARLVRTNVSTRERILSIESTDLLRYLSDGNVSTILGRLTWNNTTRFVENRRWRTVQIMPGNDVERGRQKMVHTMLSLDAPQAFPVVPMPSWHEKQMSVNVCPDGTEPMSGDDASSIVCQLCKPRHFRRRQDELYCELCPFGFYAVGFGNHVCVSCPVGAFCDDDDDHWNGLPPSSPGYYLVSSSPPTYKACAGGALFCLGANKCASHKTGLMCAFCEEGYSRDFSHSFRTGPEKLLCQPCSHGAVHGVPVLIVVVVYMTMIYLALRMGRRLTSDHEAFSIVMLRIAIDHVHLTAIVCYAAPHPESIATFVRILFRPFASLLLVDCYKGLGWVEANFLVGWFGLPAFMLLFLSYRFLELQFSLVPLSRTPFLCLDCLFGNCPGMATEDVEEVITRASLIRRAEKFSWNVKQVFLVMIYLLFPTVVWAHIEVCSCVFGPGASEEKRLYCQDYDTFTSKLVSSVGFISHAMGFLLLLVFRVWAIDHKRHHVNTLRTEGFLYLGFDSRVKRSNAVCLVMKVALMCVMVARPRDVTGSTLVVAVVLLYIMIEESLCCFSCTNFFVFRRLRLASHIFLQTWSVTVFAGEYSQMSHVILYGGPFLVWLYFWYELVLAALRVFLVKELMFVRSVSPNLLSGAYATILRCFWVNNTIEYRSGENGIFYTCLTNTEVKLLNTTIRCLIDGYFSTNVPFQAGYLVTAIREAFAMCTRDSRIRAAEVLSCSTSPEHTTLGVWRGLFLTSDSVMPQVSYISQRNWMLDSTAYIEESVGRLPSGRGRPIPHSSYNKVTVDDLYSATVLIRSQDIQQRRPSLFIIGRGRTSKLTKQYLRESEMIVDPQRQSDRSFRGPFEKDSFAEANFPMKSSAAFFEVHEEYMALSEEVSALRRACALQQEPPSPAAMYFLPGHEKIKIADASEAASTVVAIEIGNDEKGDDCGEMHCVTASLVGRGGSAGDAAASAGESAGTCGSASMVTATCIDEVRETPMKETLSVQLCLERLHEAFTASDGSDLVVLPPSQPVPQPASVATAESARACLAKCLVEETLEETVIAYSTNVVMPSPVDTEDTEGDTDGPLLEMLRVSADRNPTATDMHGRQAVAAALFASSRPIREQHCRDDAQQV